jgi:hypothetical protein
VLIIVTVHQSASPNVVIDASGASRPASRTATAATNPTGATVPAT